MDKALELDAANAVYRLLGWAFDTETHMHNISNSIPYNSILNSSVTNAQVRLGLDQRKTTLGLIFEDFYRCAWAHQGFNVFNPTHSLVAALLLTNPAPVTDDTFFTPFNAFMINIPEGFLYLWKRDIARPVRYLRVHRYSEAPSQPHRFRIWLNMDGDDQIMQEASIKVYCEPIRAKWLDIASDVPDSTPEAVNRDESTLELASRLVLNFVSWLHANGGTQAHRPEGHASTKHPDRDSHLRPTTWIIGRQVKIASELIASAKDLGQAANGTPRANWTVRFRHIVRGHMRLQACGPQHSMRKTIWIEPFWRGPEDAAAWSHVYADKAIT